MVNAAILTHTWNIRLITSHWILEVLGDSTQTTCHLLVSESLLYLKVNLLEEQEPTESSAFGTWN